MENSTRKTTNAECRDSEFLALLGQQELQLSACIHALVPSWHDAEDIIQETRLRLWRDFGKFQSGSDFSAWACTIARYVVRAYVKESQRKPMLLSPDLENTIVAEIFGAPGQNDRRIQCTSRGRCSRVRAETWRRGVGSLAAVLCRQQEDQGHCCRAGTVADGNLYGIVTHPA